MAQLTRLKLPGPRLHLLFWGGNTLVERLKTLFFSFSCLLTFHQGCITFATVLKYLQNCWKTEEPFRQNIHKLPP